MISLEGIRKKTGLVLIVIGFGMGAFILMDLMSASGSGRGVSNVVLEVFGDQHDIKELQIEGMSIGDSLLDYYSAEEIKTGKVDYYKDKEFSTFETKNLPESKIYDGIQVLYETKDKRYIIYSISGAVDCRYDFIVCKKAGVPPSSRASISSTYLCSPQGFVQSTVPPPGLSGTLLVYNFLLKTKIPVAPGPPKNLCGEK